MVEDFITLEVEEEGSDVRSAVKNFPKADARLPRSTAPCALPLRIL